MSNVVSALVQKRKVGSPTRKAILMFMASCASDDGTGVWSSKATMARDLEMGKRTVQVSIDDLVAQGLISEVGTRSCAHGFTVEYCMNLGAILALEPTNPNEVRKGKSKRSDTSTRPAKSRGAGDAPVQDVHPTGAADAPQDVQDVHPNLTGTILEPPTRTDAREAAVSEFEVIWSEYPTDRQRGKTACQECVVQALADGVPANRIIAAVRSYAKETSGYTRSKVSFADNWFKAHRWQDHGPKVSAGKSDNDPAMFWAGRIKAGKPVHGNPISAGLAREMIGRGLVSADQLQSVGVSA